MLLYNLNSDNMRITSRFINTLINKPNDLKENTSFKSEAKPALDLPKVNTIGASMVNTNLPVSYTKIGEIEIPGLKDKASVFKLANGQTVIIAPKQGPTMIKTAYNVGSMNETEDIRGMSHYIEHNLFNGSKDLAPKEYDSKLSDLGGKTNANTSFSTTNYFLSLQLLKDNSLEEAIRLNSLQTQFPTFTIEQLEKEKEPVKSEIDLYKDSPQDHALSQVLKDLFGVNTKSDNFILGTKDNINSFTREKVLDYFNTWYTPDNAITVITGDVDVNETMALVSKYYNKQNDYANINKRHYEPIKYNDKPIRRDFISPKATCANISMGFAIPEGMSKADSDKLDMIFYIFEAPNSNINKKLDKLGAKIYFGEEKMQNKPNGAKAKTIEINTTEENIEKVLKIIYEEITSISNNPPSVETLEKIKNKKINSFKAVSGNSDILNDFLSTSALNGDYDFWNSTIKNFQNIKPDDIVNTAKTFLDLNKTAICVAHTKDAKPENIINNYNNSQSQANIISFGRTYNPVQTIENETKNIKQYRLNNNIEAAVISGNPNAKSNIKIDFSTDELNNVSQGAFFILNYLLNRGSLLKNKETVDDIKLNNDINYDITVLDSGFSIFSEFQDDNLQKVLSLIKETVNYPNFSPREFEQAKKLAKEAILSEEITAQSKINEEFFRPVRSFAPKEQRLQELELITFNDIQNLYSLIMSTAKVNAVLAAPINEKPYLENIFTSELSSGMGAYRPYTKEKSQSYYTYTPNTTPKTILQADERKQAEIVRAYKYKKSENIDDIAKIKALTTLLGGRGYMSSRLFLDLREDRKLAYSVNAYTEQSKDTEAISLHITTTTDSPDNKEGAPENINKALEGFDRNVNLLKTQSVSAEELEKTKNRLKTELLDDIEMNMGKTFAYSNNKNSVYDINYYQELFKAIDRLTPNDIKDAANYMFKDAPLTSIVASQKTLNALNLK